MTKKPNVLIFMLDQLRYDCLGCTGNQDIKTPNIDRLAENGILFKKAYTSCPVCMPARASFISGLYPHNHWMWTNAGMLPKDDETFMQCLQNAGYYTAFVGKAHFYGHGGGSDLRDHEGYMHARGLDYIHETTGQYSTLGTESYMTSYWKEKGHYKSFCDDYFDRLRIKKEKGMHVARPSPLPEEDYIDGYVGRKSVEWLDKYDSKQHFMFWASFPSPHTPFDAPGKYATMYDPKSMPETIAPVESIKKPSWLSPKAREFMSSKQAFSPEQFDEQKLKKLRANYYGKVTMVDDWIGRILDVYEQKGWLENTFVLLWSDHGEMLGDHGRFEKSSYFESSCHIPIIVSWPGKIKESQKSDQLVELIDCFPTILNAAGASHSNRTFGRSLLPLAQGVKKVHRDYAISEIRDFEIQTNASAMIFDGEYKYAMDSESKGFMLYNLKNDPHELENLVGHPDYLNIELRLKNTLLKRVFSTQVIRKWPAELGSRRHGREK